MGSHYSYPFLTPLKASSRNLAPYFIMILRSVKLNPVGSE